MFSKSKMQNYKTKEEQKIKINADHQRLNVIENSQTECGSLEAEELYKILSENSLAAVFIVQNGKYRFINASAVAYAAYTAHELIGQDSDTMVYPEDRENVKKLSGNIVGNP
jgi:hypothetical protein